MNPGWAPGTLEAYTAQRLQWCAIVFSPKYCKPPHHRFLMLPFGEGDSCKLPLELFLWTPTLPVVWTWDLLQEANVCSTSELYSCPQNGWPNNFCMVRSCLMLSQWVLWSFWQGIFVEMPGIEAEPFCTQSKHYAMELPALLLRCCSLLQVVAL